MRGFTLLELLVVVGILLLLMGLMMTAMTWVIDGSRVHDTETQVHAIGCKLAAEVELEGRVPAALIDFEPKLGVARWVRGGRIVDAWERPLRYVPAGKRFRLWSVGPDGVSGNADDIVFAD